MTYIATLRRLLLISYLIGSCAFLVTTVPRQAYAQDNSFLGGIKKVKEIGQEAEIKEFPGPVELIISILAVVATIIAVIALAALIWGGVMYITSLGEEDRIARAKRIILYALIGLFVIGLSALVVNVVLNILRNGV